MFYDTTALQNIVGHSSNTEKKTQYQTFYKISSHCVLCEKRDLLELWTAFVLLRSPNTS